MRFIGVYDYTVILTYISLASSIVGMTQAIHGDYKMAILCLASAALLFNRCARGKYVVITGVCTEIERTSIRKRIKAIHLQTEEHYVRLVGVRGLRSLSIGEVPIALR